MNNNNKIKEIKYSIKLVKLDIDRKERDIKDLRNKIKKMKMDIKRLKAEDKDREKIEFLKKSIDDLNREK